MDMKSNLVQSELSCFGDEQGLKMAMYLVPDLPRVRVIYNLL
jgi:hypothetical protein